MRFPVCFWGDPKDRLHGLTNRLNLPCSIGFSVFFAYRDCEILLSKLVIPRPGPMRRTGGIQKLNGIKLWTPRSSRGVTINTINGCLTGSSEINRGAQY